MDDKPRIRVIETESVIQKSHRKPPVEHENYGIVKWVLNDTISRVEKQDYGVMERGAYFHGGRVDYTKPERVHYQSSKKPV